MTRLYHLVAVNDRTGTRTRLTARPATHAECMTMKARFTPAPAVRITVEEVAQ